MQCRKELILLFQSGNWRQPHEAKFTNITAAQPAKFMMVFDLKIAKALGLTIPPSIHARADEMIG